ncbi:hypothetical protein MRX96_017209 [Rhipicephalus microplus]
MEMVEELACYWSNSEEPDEPTDSGWLPYIEIRLTEVDHGASSPGMRCGRLVTRLSVPISQEDNTLPMQVLMQAALEMFTREYRSTTSPSDDLKTQL